METELQIEGTVSSFIEYSEVNEFTNSLYMLQVVEMVN